MTNDKKILDACCGSKSFWFDKTNSQVLFMDKRKEVLRVNDAAKKLGYRILNICPDVVADFTAMPFDNETFFHVVFDPPHMISLGEKSWMAQKYGRLLPGWETVIQKGFAECMRVLKSNGTLIFKWNEHEVKLSQVIQLIKEIGFEPLYGHTTGRQAKTIWMCFIKN